MAEDRREHDVGEDHQRGLGPAYRQRDIGDVPLVDHRRDTDDQVGDQHALAGSG